MSARALLGKAIEPYVHDEGGDEVRIELKVPKFAVALPILRSHQKYALDMMRQLRGILRDEDVGEPTQSPFEIAVPLVQTCMVEEFEEDEVYELLVMMGIRIELDLQHPLFVRCLELCGLRQGATDDVEISEDQILEALKGKDPEVADPT